MTIPSAETLVKESRYFVMSEDELYEFVSLGNIKGSQDEVAPRIEKRKKEEAKRFGVKVREVLYVGGRGQSTTTNVRTMLLRF